jgi:hypothetical protein
MAASTETIVQRVLSEDVLTIAQARTEIQAIAGSKPDRATLTRWILKGCGGVKLDSVRIGRQWVTSKQSVNRFIVARSQHV